MIEKNQQVCILKDHLPPLNSPNTHLVAALRACEGKVADQGYHCTVGIDDKGQPRHTVVWAIDQTAITFTPIEKAESITPGEFIKRFMDRSWIEKNANHPIAYCWALLNELKFLRSEIKRIGVGQEIRRNGYKLFIPGDATPEEREKALRMLEKEASR